MRIVGPTNWTDRQIFSDDFTANNTYREFEYEFTISGTPLCSSGENETDITGMIPEGSPESTMQVALDYQVEYHGNRTLTVDRAIIENRWGDRLYDGLKDSDLLTDVPWAFSQDGGDPTIRGFYSDEPQITRIDPMRYVNDLIGPITPSRFGFRETIQSTVNRNYVFNQYLNAGLPENQDQKLLVDRYPIGYGAGAPAPGNPGYNAYIQNRWENDLIPFLADAALVSSINGKPFWYATQAHSWRTDNRDPDPIEIRAMVNLGLAYGAKGIFYFLYTSIPAENAIGLVDAFYRHNYEPYQSKWNEVQQINANLQRMASDLLALNWESAFTSGDVVPPGSVVQNIAGGDYIEIGNFSHQSTSEQYFMLVNRRCEDTDTQTITITLSGSGSRRLIEDVLTSRTPWDGNANRVAYRILDAGESSFVVTLNPGEGRLFRITNGLVGTFVDNRYWSGEVLITGNIIVNSSATLTVHEGTKVNFENNCGLFVFSNLQATGSSSHRITFTSMQGDFNPSIWYYIRIVNTSQTSNLDWCNVYSASTGIVIENVTGTVNVTNCRIRYNSIGVLTQNSSGPIWIQNSIIQNNQTGIWVNNTKPYIKYTDITQNSSYGLYLYNQAKAYLGYNNIYSNGEGIYCYYNSSPVLYGSCGHNWIYNNSADGISGRNNSYPYLGFDILNKYGWNHIYANSGYEVANRNSGSTYISAERNYWSASETNPVHPSDVYGLVDWVPVLPDNPPKGIKSDDMALILELNEHYEEAVAAYITAIENYPNSWDVGFFMSGLIRCYEALGRESEITDLLNYFIFKYSTTKAAILAAEFSLPFLLAQGSWEKGLERAKELLELNRGTKREAIFLFEIASFYLAKSANNFGIDQNSVIDNYQILVNRYPDCGLSLWANIWLKTDATQSPGKSISQHYQLPVIIEPIAVSFSNNYPNPFNPETRIDFALSKGTHVLVEVYNVLG